MVTTDEILDALDKELAWLIPRLAVRPRHDDLVPVVRHTVAGAARKLIRTTAKAEGWKLPYDWTENLRDVGIDPATLTVSDQAKFEISRPGWINADKPPANKTSASSCQGAPPITEVAPPKKVEPPRTLKPAPPDLIL